MIRRGFLVTRIALTVLLAVGCPARANDSVEQRVKGISDAYASLGRFSGAILVAQHGRVVFARGYGQANKELNVPNTRETKFDLGSLSKQFTAAAILKLESQGKLSVNDLIARYLPDYPKPQGERITIHHLLTHTSGIPSLGQRGGISEPPNRSDPVSLEELIALFKDHPLQFNPGEKYRYNNSGYILLAAIIEKASGQTYDAYLKRNLFDPAGMSDTGRQPVSKVATGYLGYAPEFTKAAFVHPSWAIGAGGIYSTVNDLFKWNIALDAGKVLSPEQTERFFKAHVSRGRPGRNYAYGWFIDEVHGERAINHGGTTEGFVSAYYRFPERGLLIVVLSNYMPRLGIDISDQIADRVAAEIIGDHYEVLPVTTRLSDRELRRFVGEYEFERGYKLTIQLRNHQLVSSTAGKDWTLPTYSSLVKLDRRAPKVEKAVRIVRAFVAGDHETISELAAPGRREEITKDAVIAVKNEVAEKWGRLMAITPFAVGKDGAVRHRVTFTKGEMFMLIEFNDKDEFVGWFYGNRMMPPAVPLIPVLAKQSPDRNRQTSFRFYADGFRYDEGAAWGEKPVFLEFRLDREKVIDVVIEQNGEYRGRKVVGGG